MVFKGKLRIFYTNRIEVLEIFFIFVDGLRVDSMIVNCILFREKH